MLTQEQIGLVKKSWRLLRSIDPSIIAGTFYAKLFNDHPRLKRYFPTDMEPQYKKLMDMLSVIISRLDRMEEITEEIAAMAERHVQYGVRTEHYAMVGKALLWTLQQGLGNDWNKELEVAWNETYAMLANTMINAPRHMA